MAGFGSVIPDKSSPMNDWPDESGDGSVAENAFMNSFLQSITMILVSELGDKTFFIAAILAMKHPRVTVFSGAISALALMTVLSAAMGYALPNLLSPFFTTLASIGLFVVFGLQLLKSGLTMGAEGGGMAEELAEVEEELAEIDMDAETAQLEGGGAGNGKVKPSLAHTLFASFGFSVLWIQCFSMTFLAEWGDRSQIATIALAAAAGANASGVILGGILGHSFCTGLAVLGGKLMASKFSERGIALSGGTLFLLFAIHSLWEMPEYNATFGDVDN